MKKKIFLLLPILLVAALCMCLTSCGGGDDDGDLTSGGPQAQQNGNDNNGQNNGENGGANNLQIPKHIMNPLTLEAIGNGVITYQNRGFYDAYYMIDNGEAHIISPDTNAEIPVSAGQKVTLWGNNVTCYNPVTHLCSNINCTAEFYAYGNVMSLLNGSTEISREYAFAGLFADATTLRSHPVKYLLLPATKLSDHCYYGMFKNCTGLTRVPNLPATTLASYCYHSMFSGCSKLTTAPELPATELASWCYTGMFYNCDALIAAPELPATELTFACYSSMFYSCDNLTVAPELPAATLAQGCYSSMFYECTKLNYVKCMATDMSAENCTGNWLYYVASTGTFVKATGTDWSGKTSASGIPSGWTVTTASN